jgi:hypothetical protein
MKGGGARCLRWRTAVRPSLGCAGRGWSRCFLAIAPGGGDLGRGNSCIFRISGMSLISIKQMNSII